MKIIFACAGTQRRWDNFLNTPKHLALVEKGIPLLKRNIDEFSVFFNIKKFYVSIRNTELQKIYKVDSRIVFYIPESIREQETPYETLIPFIESTNESILMLLGDVLFSRECIKKIYKNIQKNTFTVFGRKFESKITGCKWGELFAFYIPNNFKKTFIEAILKVNEMFQNLHLKRKTGWEIISYLYSDHSVQNLLDVFEKRLFPESFIEVDDETDDFDSPHCYVTMMNLLN